MITVEITRAVQKGLSKAPDYIQVKFAKWVLDVQTDGLDAIRQCKGYHDEPLLGKRSGQRSIRLNQQWRAIYTETQAGITITILEVTPHDY